MHVRKILTILALTVVGCFAAVGNASAVTAGNTGWEWSNPLPQGNTLLTVETVGDRVYVGGANGTLMRSNDAGANWSAIRSGLLDGIQTIRAISADSIIFAAKCALRRSDDGGNTVKRLAWGPSDESCGSEIVSAHFPSSIVGYLLLKNGEILSTIDGGDSWAKKTAAPGSRAVGGSAEVSDIWFTSNSEGVIAVGNQLFRTTDNASSWTPVADVGASKYTFDFVSATEGVAVGTTGPAMVTSDAGANWTPHLSAQSSESLRQVSCANVNNCLASTTDSQRVLNTTDAAVNWQTVTASTAKLYGVGLSSPTRGIAVGVAGAIVATNDTGATWSPVNSGVGGIYERLSASNANNAIIAGRAGALARTSDAGRSWRAVNVSTSADVVDAVFLGVSRGYVVDSLGAVLRTDNGGVSWRFLDTGTTTRPRDLHAINESTILLAGPKGVLRSSDGGETFAATGNRAFRRAAISTIDTAGSLLYAYGSKLAFVSKNGGQTWTRAKTPKKAKSIKVLDMISAKIGFALDTKSELWTTSTAGRKWTRVETTGSGFVSSMAFGDRLTGYLTSIDGRVLMTSNGGKTWSRQYPYYDGVNYYPMRIAAPSGKSAFVLVEGTNRVFATSSAGVFGEASKLTIKSSSKKVRKRTVVRVTGKLSPAAGGERVTVLARAIGAKSGTRWTSQERTVSASGTFTTSWRVTKPTIFIARWSGDAAHDGAAATAIRVVIRR